jgi:hypothetical protein
MKCEGSAEDAPAAPATLRKNPKIRQVRVIRKPGK